MPKTSETLLTQELRNKKKKTKLTPEEMAFVDLLCLGWQEMDAYIITGLHNPLFNVVNNRDSLDRLKARKEFGLYYEQRKMEIQSMYGNSDDTDRHMSDAELAVAMSKDTQLKALFRARDKYVEGTKEWNDVQKMIIDVSQVKKDEIVEEEEKVHYYIPLVCGRCPFKDYYERSEGGE